jgi:hypothetical protein
LKQELAIEQADAATSSKRNLTLVKKETAVQQADSVEVDYEEFLNQYGIRSEFA